MPHTRKVFPRTHGDCKKKPKCPFARYLLYRFWLHEDEASFQATLSTQTHDRFQSIPATKMLLKVAALPVLADLSSRWPGCVFFFPRGKSSRKAEVCALESRRDGAKQTHRMVINVLADAPKRSL